MKTMARNDKSTHLVEQAFLKDDSLVVTMSQAAGKHHHETCKGKNPDKHKKGPPSSHIGLAMLSALHDDPSMSPELKAGLKEIIEFPKLQDVEGAARTIKN